MLKKALATLALMLSLGAHAAEVTLNEAAIEAIFSQDGFGANAIDIRYGELEVMEADALLELAVDEFGSVPEFSELEDRSFQADNSSIYMYFIDRFVNEDGTDSSLQGLANRNTVVVVSDIAKGSVGAILQAHEIGHLLGLDHCPDSNFGIDLCTDDANENLMDPVPAEPPTPFSTLLEQGQIDLMLTNPKLPLIKRDGDGNYLTVIPVLVRAALVDGDDDGIEDTVDNCVATPNPYQVDSDGDEAGDACDVCPLDPDNDIDGDGFCAEADNCPAVANTSQADTDDDGFGDACNTGTDSDADDWADHLDNCPAAFNPSQSNSDCDVLGDACDACPFDAVNDADGDGLCGDIDNCPALANPDQRNTDGDSVGNACDLDDDGDGVSDDTDNCPLNQNADQRDDDQDGLGNACDADNDNDGIDEAADECPDTGAGAMIDASGCSIAQYCPVDGNWKNQGAYLRCVVKTAKAFLADNLIDSAAVDAEISSAASSKSGK